jgi:hypothetical protein
VHQVAHIFFWLAFWLVNFSFGILILEAWELAIVVSTKLEDKIEAMAT